MTPWEFAGGSLRRLAIGIGCAIPFGVWILTGNALLGAATFVVFLIIATRMGNLFRSNAPDMDGWLDSVSRCQYRSASQSSGIALDITTHTIHLTQNAGKPQGQLAKSYPFNHIRDAQPEAIALRVDVADPAHPHWHINLPSNVTSSNGPTRADASSNGTGTGGR